MYCFIELLHPGSFLNLQKHVLMIDIKGDVGVDLSILKLLETARIDIKNQGEGNDVKVRVLSGEHCKNPSCPLVFQRGHWPYAGDRG